MNDEFRFPSFWFCNCCENKFNTKELKEFGHILLCPGCMGEIKRSG